MYVDLCVSWEMFQLKYWGPLVVPALIITTLSEEIKRKSASVSKQQRNQKVGNMNRLSAPSISCISPKNDPHTHSTKRSDPPRPSSDSSPTCRSRSFSVRLDFFAKA